MACPTYTVAPGASMATQATWGGPVALTATSGNFGLTTGSVDLVCADNSHHPLMVTAWAASSIAVTLPATSPCAGPYKIAVNTLTDTNCQTPIFIGSVMGGSVPDVQTLAQNILAFTQIEWDPKNPKPGDEVVVRIIPGLPLGFPAPAGDLTDLLNTLVSSIKISVEYAVEDGDGNPVSNRVTPISPQSPSPQPPPAPLQAVLTIAPRFVDELQIGDPLKPYNLVAKITVEADGMQHPGTITVPLPMPPVPIPGVLLVSKDANHSGELFILVRTGSALTSAGAIVSTINSVIQVVNSVKDVVAFATLLLPHLHQAVDTINNAGGIAGIASGGASDLEDYDEFDDEGSSMLLIAPAGTTVEFFNDEDFSGPFVGEGHKSTVTAEDVGATLGVATGIGVHEESDWSNRPWDDSDGNDNMNDDMVSVRFV
jgi:hypothetical protein